MKKILLIVTLFCSLLASGQSTFISEGKITFERRISQFNINKQENEEETFWDEEIKKVMSKVLVDQFTLEFTPEKSYYKNGKEDHWRSKAIEVQIKIKDYLWNDKRKACFDKDKNNKRTKL